MKIRLSELRTIIRDTVSEMMNHEKADEMVKEADELDVNKDGKKDFTDVMAARMKASGMDKKTAIKKAEKATAKRQK